MVRRHAGKTNPRAAPAHRRARPEKSGAPEGTLRERLSALERERDTLRDALEHEQARNRKLEQAQSAARDRVAWALDTLHNILGGKS